MAGVYGNILDQFPELFSMVTFWEMEKLAPSGFGEHVNEREIAVIVLNDAGDAIKRKPVLDAWVLDSTSNDAMYSYDDADIAIGSYLIHPYTGELNKVMKKFSYALVAGMAVWGIERVQGEDPEDPKTLAPIGGTF